jgi:extracellular factor (EF) 3-hydroxypalmitic acid methyl ester biosynthesis protein
MRGMRVNEAVFDQLYCDSEAGHHAAGVAFLASFLDYTRSTQASWAITKESLRAHPLFQLVQLDPYTAHSYRRPRGYPGDADLIEMIYSRIPPDEPDGVGMDLFQTTTAAGACEAVRQRLGFATELLTKAVADGRSVCSLACGHLKEADHLAGQAMGRFTAVDLDGASLARVRKLHGERIRTVEANAFKWLRAEARSGNRYDLVYSLGLTDYFDDRKLGLLTRLAADILAPGGRLIFANFLEHRWSAYMDACMDWRLI